MADEADKKRVARKTDQLIEEQQSQQKMTSAEDANRNKRWC
jgi:hypothetical protein